MVRDELTDQCSHWVLTSWVFPLCSHHVSPVHVRDFGPPPRGGDCPRRETRGRGPAHGGPGGRLRRRYRGGGPGAGRDAPPKTRLDAWEFAAKSKMARRFVTLGPPRGGGTARGGRCGGGGRPRGVRGAASATVTLLSTTDDVRRPGCRRTCQSPPPLRYQPATTPKLTIARRHLHTVSFRAPKTAHVQETRKGELLEKLIGRMED
jgi:hypothetical protein